MLAAAPSKVPFYIAGGALVAALSTVAVRRTLRRADYALAAL
jgi:hypothetical protein